MGASTTASPIEAIDRALLLLNELAAAGAKGAALADLAQALGINKSTAYRALFTLRARDFVQQDADTGHYLLGPAAIALGTRYLDGDSLAVLLHPALVALSREVDELVHLGVLAADRVLYIDKVEPDRADPGLVPDRPDGPGGQHLLGPCAVGLSGHRTRAAAPRT